MVTLSEAIKLTKPESNEIIWLRQAGKMKCGLCWQSIPMTMSEVRKKYDMKAIKVHDISPVFVFHEYDGLEYVVTGPGFDKEG